ncbi:MAG TPA: hypothetical protein VGC91_02675 [Pyrinomonadaceae bacterium]|jgi:hypothetical protein
MTRPSPFSANMQSGGQQTAGRPATSQVHKSAHTPTAPQVYRPQPVPKVLQTKANGVAPSSSGHQPHRPTVGSPAARPPQPAGHALQKNAASQKPLSMRSETKLARAAALPVYRAQPVAGVQQSKKNSAQHEAMQDRVSQTRAFTSQHGRQQATVQPFGSRVVQAVKYYPNLHPGAVEPVERGNVFRLDSFADQYRLRRENSHGVNVPNQQYNFVRTREGEMLLHSRYRHPSIAEGKQVLYAGEIYFNNGKLQWWSNGSGHYQPYVEDAGQANLPMDHFFSYQQIIKGEHTRKKG